MHRDFKGIWIPKKIWFISGLKPAYRVFLAEIDSLDNEEGCTAENEHFAELFGLSKNRCSEIITMLCELGFISIQREDLGGGKTKRILKVLDPFGKSTPPSRNRQTPSRNRQGIYKDEKYNEKYSEIGAREFLKKNHPLKLESWEMQNKSQIDDWKKFWLDFEAKVTLEEISFEAPKLFARLGSFSRNWIRNNKKQQTEISTNHPSRKRIA